MRRKKGGFEEAKPEQANEKLCWQDALDEAIESFRFEDEEDYGNHSFLTYSLKVDNPESFILLFFTTKVSTLISVEGDKALSRSLNYKISTI